MKNDERNPKVEVRKAKLRRLAFGIRALGFFRHSAFVIGHSRRQEIAMT